MKNIVDQVDEMEAQLKCCIFVRYPMSSKETAVLLINKREQKHLICYNFNRHTKLYGNLMLSTDKLKYVRLLGTFKPF